MMNWEDVLVTPDTTLREALERIDAVGSNMALVVDAQSRLLGTLSDGDARRALLKGLSLTAPASLAMNTKPVIGRESDARQSVISIMRQRGLRQMPITDPNMVVVGMAVIDDFLTVVERTNWVLLMVGGLGSRLEKLTKDTPKPMLKVGARPLLETIVSGYSEQGFKRIYLAVNFKAEQIEQHFDDGSRFGVEIRYLREEKRLGTAGALSLIPEALNEPLVVANGDVLTKKDVGQLVDQHLEASVDVTMAVREYEMQIPFGVVRESNGLITSIEEKPVQRFIISAGINVLSPKVVGIVPHDTYFDMPQLIDCAIAYGLSVQAHRFEGYWLDIGQFSDYERANHEFDEVFR